MLKPNKTDYLGAQLGRKKFRNLLYWGKILYISLSFVKGIVECKPRAIEKLKDTKYVKKTSSYFVKDSG